MQYRLTTLLDLRIRTASDETFPIRAIFYREDSRDLTYVAVDIGGWLDRHEVLIAMDRLGQPSEKDWPVQMTREEIEAAPAYESQEGGISGGLPPLIVGPLGYTFSPMMILAGMEASAARSMPADPDAESADLVSRAGGRLFEMARCSDLIGRPAFGESGEMGRVDDLIVTDNALTAAVLDDGSELSFERLRHVADQGHLIFD